jgi:hypothetical protein
MMPLYVGADVTTDLGSDGCGPEDPYLYYTRGLSTSM